MRTYIFIGCLAVLGNLQYYKVASSSDPDIYLEDDGSGDSETFPDLDPIGGGVHYPPDEEETGSGMYPDSEGGGGTRESGGDIAPDDDDDYYTNSYYDEDEGDYFSEYDTTEGSGFHPSHTREGLETYVAHVVPETVKDVEETILLDKIETVFEESPDRMPSTTPPPTLTDNQHGMDNTVRILTQKDEERQVSIFAQPGILAAFIGGAVMGLLCAILLVMFIVYRMRKRDEGSYPLDEPKRVPLTSSYSPNDKEIYA